MPGKGKSGCTSELHTPHNTGWRRGTPYTATDETRGSPRAPRSKWPSISQRARQSPVRLCSRPAGLSRLLPEAAARPRARPDAATLAGSAAGARGFCAARGRRRGAGAGRTGRRLRPLPSRRPAAAAPAWGPRVPGLLTPPAPLLLKAEAEQGGQAFRKLPGRQPLEESQPLSPADMGTDQPEPR